MKKKQCWPILEQINFLSNAIYNSLIAEKTRVVIGAVQI